MKRIQRLVCGLTILVFIVPVFAEKGSARSSGKEKRTAPVQASAASERGQLVFEQNCSRCHNAPESFPPQISATIIRHMRVRASLSAADEKALLRFLNP